MQKTLLWVELVGGVIGLLIFVFGIPIYVDARIEKYLNNPKVLSNIASQLTPTMIFNIKNQILFDRGASQHIESVSMLQVRGESPQILQ
jgi:hypothetical protein